MAKSEVTLLLGEQMAIVYLGVNIALPLVFSAVLAFIILVIVQLSRFFKKRMGRSNSKVVILKPNIPESNTTDPAVERNDRPSSGTTGSKGPQKELPTSITGHGLVRKRRPSIISESTPSPEPIPSVSSEGSYNSRDHMMPSSSSSRPSSALSRIRRISSSNRISPETPTGEQSRTPTLSGAWTEIVSNETSRSLTKKKRKNSDRILSPSDCQINGLSDDTDGATEKISSTVYYADDMNVFDIW